VSATQPWPVFLDEDFLARHGVLRSAELQRAMRPEDVAMQPERLRASKASRLSFMRTLVKRMVDRKWRIERRLSDLSLTGEGLMIYDIDAEGSALSFVVWASAPESEEDRLGRFYETRYDFYGAMLEGKVDRSRAQAEADRMRHNVWQGRTDNGCLGWTVANRSNRFFNHVLERLAAGRQPDQAFLSSGGGYIVRNAGWYGNGRHGSRSWLSLGEESPFFEPYHLDLFSLFLWRLVSCDAAETIAGQQSTKAVELDRDVRSYLGIGNSSGIGMVAALVRWPAWLGTYCTLREVVRAFVVTRKSTTSEQFDRFVRLLERAAAYYAQQPAQVVDEAEQPEALARALADFSAGLRGDRTALCRSDYPWREVAARAERLGSLEVEEQVNSLLMEVEPAFADAVAGRFRHGMAVSRAIDPDMTCGEMLEILQDRYDWALALDLSAPGARAYFWYKSEENGENRRGERAVDPGLENETFVDVAGTAQHLERALSGAPESQPIAVFLLLNPAFAHMVSRVQLSTRIPYSEIRTNIIARDFLPMDGIRFLLGMFGLEASAPYSTRWVRGVFLQGAPMPSDFASGLMGDWLFPRAAFGGE